jgi:hypothetical protein
LALFSPRIVFNAMFGGFFARDEHDRVAIAEQGHVNSLVDGTENLVSMTPELVPCYRHLCNSIIHRQTS